MGKVKPSVSSMSSISFGVIRINWIVLLGMTLPSVHVRMRGVWHMRMRGVWHMCMRGVRHMRMRGVWHMRMRGVWHMCMRGVWHVRMQHHTLP